MHPRSTLVELPRTPSRRLAVATTAAVLALMPVACGGSDSTDGTEPEPAPTSDAATTTISVEETTTTVAAAPVVIGLVAPSAIDDASFTQSMVDSLDRLAAVRQIEFEVAADLPSPDGALFAAQAFAADGADIVIVHGSQFRSVVARVAGEHPDVAVAWGTAADDVDLPNVFSYSAAADQGGYVNGVIAAGLTTSGRIGAIGPIQLGDAGLYVDGFQVGALAADPSVEVSIAFLDSYTDTLLAEEAAMVMTGFGGDVLTSTSQISSGVLEHARSVGVPLLGTQSSAIPLAPAVVVAAQVYHWEIALDELLEIVESAGGSEGGVSDGAGSALEQLSLANGGLTIEFNDDYELPAAVRDAADTAIAGLIDGTIETGLG